MEQLQQLHMGKASFKVDITRKLQQVLLIQMDMMMWHFLFRRMWVNR